MIARTEARFFSTAAAFRTWLEKNHDRFDELFVGFWKKGCGKSGMTYPEAVDQALCFGWIDGVRHARDAESYTNRFTPRRARSVWSAVNLRRFAELEAAGLVRPAGRAAFEARDVARTQLLAVQRDAPLEAALEAKLKRNRAAWAFWQAQPPGYRKLATWWIMSAKRDETRMRRLETLIDDSARGERIAALGPPVKAKSTTTKRRKS